MPFACHKCDNGLCVRFSHLFEGDQEANMQDMARKERGGSTKLTAEQVKLIRTALNNGAVGAQLARDYGIAKSTVCDIKKGRSWPKEVNL
jgi:predicted DNA binding protein